MMRPQTGAAFETAWRTTVISPTAIIKPDHPTRSIHSSRPLGAVSVRCRRLGWLGAVLMLMLAFGSPARAVAQEFIAELPYDPTLCWFAAQDSENCHAMMRAHPQPTFERVLPDLLTLESYSFWKVGPQAVNLYAAPGGAVIGQIPAGFNFVNAIDTDTAGWIQRFGGEWIRRADAEYVRASYFTGFLLPADWQHPFAVILDRSGIYASLQPGEQGSAESGYVTRRYELVNIYAQQEDSEGSLWYLIGPDQWLRQEFVAKFAPTAPPPDVSGHWMAVDLFEQTLIAYEDEQPVFATLISSGLPAWSTNEGVFEIWARLERDSMSGATGAPDAYALQDVPWTMYFDGDISLHGTYWHDGFGYRRSHGCVNLSISDAHWLYEWTLSAPPDEKGQVINAVHVFSSGEYANE